MYLIIIILHKYIKVVKKSMLMKFDSSAYQIGRKATHQSSDPVRNAQHLEQILQGRVHNIVFSGEKGVCGWGGGGGRARARERERGGGRETERYIDINRLQNLLHVYLAMQCVPHTTKLSFSTKGCV